MNSSTGSGGFDIAVALERAAVDCPAFRLDASLQTGPGITVLFGTSGAGKSTLSWLPAAPCSMPAGVSIFRCTCAGSGSCFRTPFSFLT
jgi:hypothetical protein